MLAHSAHPKAFLDYDGASYDSYLELDRTIFFLIQTVARGVVAHGQGGSIVNIGSMCAHQAIAARKAVGYCEPSPSAARPTTCLNVATLLAILSPS